MSASGIGLYASDGVRLSGLVYETPGATAAYALAHGFTGSVHEAKVTSICERLAARGATVLALDFRGHGRSGGASTIGVEEEFDHDAAVAHLRGAGYPTVISAGWSMGGSVVLRHAALHPGTVDAVVSVSSPGLWYERGTEAMRRVHLAAETRLGRAVVQRLLHTRIGTGRGWIVLPESPVELVGRITAPLLLVHGDADHYFPLRHAEALARAAPAAQLWVEAGMGHAETSTTPALLDRIDDWARGVTRSTDRTSGAVSGGTSCEQSSAGSSGTMAG